MKNHISDTSDFTGTRIPKLSQLDTLLRCHICKDFLKVPVLTPCGHTFCSLCIRGYISTQAKCPLCLTELRESMLRSEFLVNEIVDSYIAVRDDILTCIKEACDLNERNESDSIIELASEPSDSFTETIDDGQNSDDIQILETKNTNPMKRTTMNILSLSSKNNTSGASKRLKRSSTASRMESLFQKSAEMAQCPICEKFFPVKQLERTHLDECLTLQALDNNFKPSNESNIDRQLVKNTTPKIPRNISLSDSFKINRAKDDSVSHVDRYMNSNIESEHQRLPKLDLSSMSISQMKQKLSSLGLSTQGSKHEMIARYNYYEILWNSNFCDSINPVNESELRRQLVSWETSHKSNTNKNTPNSIGNLMSLRSTKGNNIQDAYKKLLVNFKNDKFDRNGWTKLFLKQFRLLIKEAKKSSTKLTKNEELEVSAKNDEQLTDPDLSTEFLGKWENEDK